MKKPNRRILHRYLEYRFRKFNFFYNDMGRKTSIDSIILWENGARQNVVAGFLIFFCRSESAFE